MVKIEMKIRGEKEKEARKKKTEKSNKEVS